jgi:hypothetical protein
MYHVKVRGGYLWRGKVVPSVDHATTYTSYSAAERGLQHAIDAGFVSTGRIVAVSATIGPPMRGADATAAKRQAGVKARLEEDGGKRIPVKLFGRQVQKVDQLIQNGYADDQQAVIRRLIDEKKV